MGFSGKKWELIGDRGIYRNYGRYTLLWGLWLAPRVFMERCLTLHRLFVNQVQIYECVFISF